VSYSLSDPDYDKLSDYLSPVTMSILDNIKTTSVVGPRGNPNVRNNPNNNINTITLCVDRKCPNGNMAINVGKIFNKNQNVYGCIVSPDEEVHQDGSTSLKCKESLLLKKETSNLPYDVCVSLPNMYLPNFQ
jgi:hypothetical protein